MMMNLFILGSHRVASIEGSELHPSQPADAEASLAMFTIATTKTTNVMPPLSNNNKRSLLATVLLLAACFCSDAFLQPYGGNHHWKQRQPIYYRQRDASTVTHTEDDHKQSDATPTPTLNHPFIPWPNRAVECEGDYTKETYLEQIIGGQLYENNNKNALPVLPVPTLKQTIERFLPTALPLCESDEERQSLIRACDKFEEQAKDLQLRLLQRKDDWKYSSWLQKWWNQKGYLEVRDPVAVHVSYFLSIEDDPTLPTQEELDNDGDYFGATNPGILRGAAAMIAAAKARKRICSGQLPCDKAGSKPLCSTGYKYLFNACRVPREESDVVRIYDPSTVKHCIVACKGYFFAVDFVDDQANPLPLASLVKTLVKCQHIAKEQESLNMPKAVGWLSGCNRDLWASSLNKLTRYESFEKALKVLESGAFVLCLDETTPETESDASEFFWDGKGVLGCNRFFDKSVNIMVNRLGQAALLGEHSMMDGSIPMVICNQLQKFKYARLNSASLRLASPDKRIEDVEVLDIFGDCWKDEDLTNLANRLGEFGRKQYMELADSVELKTIVHKDYGKQFIKKGGVSPDAFMQLVLQLAAYRCFGKQIATYEATQTRQFVHGRTETARTVSIDSKAFVEAMGLKSVADSHDTDAKQDKLKLLIQAAESHHEYTRSACNGLGVDRHFLGLSLVTREDEELPDLFKDPVFTRSKTWRLSTSGLPSCPGFGAVVKDGIGVGYGLHSNSGLLHVSSRKENKCVDKFCKEVVLALKEMKGLLETKVDILAQK
ncbi:hypothetical protein ACHAXM_003684 [Skeletonema potamos]